MRLVPAEGRILDGILSESHTIWSDGLTRQAYARYNAAQLRTPWGARHLRRFALVDGAHVLASAKRYEFIARVDGERVRAVGIGAVFTPEQQRRRGYAREIIDRLVTDATADGAAIAVLFSEIDPVYYARMGFAAIPRRELTIHARTGNRAGAPAVLVRAGEERDIPAVTALARAMTNPHRFAIEPDEDFVRFGLTKKRLLAGLLDPHLLSVEFFIVEEGAGAVAFAILTVTSEDVVLEMCGDRDPTGARVGALLQVLAARDPANSPPAISCFLPPGWVPPQVEIDGGAPVREVMMVKPLREGVLTRPLTAENVLYWHGDLF